MVGEIGAIDGIRTHTEWILMVQDIGTAPINSFNPVSIASTYWATITFLNHYNNYIIFLRFCQLSSFINFIKININSPLSIEEPAI